MQTPYLCIILSVLLASCQGPDNPAPKPGKDTSTTVKITPEIMADPADMPMASVKADEYYDNYPPDSVPPDIEKQLPAGYVPLVIILSTVNNVWSLTDLMNSCPN